MEPLKDAHGNYYYRKYINPQPPPQQQTLSLEMAYEKIAELIQVFDDNFSRVIILETKIKKLEEKEKLLENLRK